MTNGIARKLGYWCEVLGLDGHRVEVEVISPNQVTDEKGETGAHLVGGRRITEDSIVIFTTRRLREDDVVHELLHVRFPEMSEGEVRSETRSLRIARDLNFIGGFAKER